MLISKELIEQKRTPSELRDFVAGIKREVEEDDKERHDGILRKGYYKEFLDEIVPLSCFAMLAYPETFVVQPVIGNQGYDAIVFDSNGQIYEYVELTIPFDGNEQAKDAERVVKNGYGHIYVGSPADELQTLAPFVLDTCSKKALNDYHECSLVITLAMLPPLPKFEACIQAQIAKIAHEISSINFKSKKVYLLAIPDRLIRIC